MQSKYFSPRDIERVNAHALGALGSKNETSQRDETVFESINMYDHRGSIESIDQSANIFDEIITFSFLF